ncbi:hypothetical protein RB3506 [Rhodopirellula baltica SH 1]|uniref:Uncharacterized protein n=1 Tax=Rhodopirellula baltica (strain DSM 10527 / NCIMB 13988 / SH1) TaxID=243090 RepID=Q7UU50_RHOBA|nr:hypothetical protein RB3506 [Rhodopirellula baltica SH 1]
MIKPHESRSRAYSKPRCSHEEPERMPKRLKWFCPSFPSELLSSLLI